MTQEEQELHDLEINAEIIRGYCWYTQCHLCPAFQACDENGEAWDEPELNFTTQRAMLDAFEAELPVENDMPDAVPRDIPQVVRATVEARIMELTEQVIALTEQIKAMEAERDALIDWRNGVGI